jgi:hypothetical protein
VAVDHPVAVVTRWQWCVTERERERGETESYLHIFLDKLEYNKAPLFVNIDIR